MRQIKNVVFDFGGVIIDIDRDRAVKKFVEIGVKDADNLLDKYHQKGIFLEIEDGRIDAESFRLKLSEICGKELTYKEVEMGWRGFVTAVEQYKLDYLNILRHKNEVSDNGISEDEDLIKREVIQGDADLFYLHHYLSEVFRKGDNF